MREGDMETNYLARWKCPDCGRTQCGWITADDNAPRRCEGIPKDRRTDANRNGRRICGALMQCVYSERPRAHMPSQPEPEERSGRDGAQ